MAWASIDDAACCKTVCGIDPFCCDIEWDGICADEAAKLCEPGGGCPGEGSCFEANGTPGCDDEACCTVVCENTPTCCEVEWDQSCADQALKFCQ